VHLPGKALAASIGSLTAEGVAHGPPTAALGRFRKAPRHHERIHCTLSLRRLVSGPSLLASFAVEHRTEVEMPREPLHLPAVARRDDACLHLVGRCPAPGPVAAYSFNEGSGTTVADSSGNNNTGTLSGVTWTTAGKFSNALVFNGTTARVNIPNSPSL
jgi:hypothetical protein